MTRGRHERGLSLVEVLIAIVLLGIVIVPAMQALQTGVTGSAVHGDLSTTSYRVTSRLEEVLAEPFHRLAAAADAAGGPTTPSSYSEAAGPPGRLLVFLAYFDADDMDMDGDPFTGVDNDVLWIRVESEYSVHGVETIIASGN